MVSNPYPGWGGSSYYTAYVPPATATPKFNPYEAQLKRQEAELQKLRKDKKYDTFFITGMALALLMGALTKVLERASKVSL